MLEALTRTEVLYGQVHVDGSLVGGCHYELTFNPYETNEMSVVLFDPPAGIPFGREGCELTVESDFGAGRYHCRLNADLASSGNQYRAPVTEFYRDQWFDEREKGQTVEVAYLFAPTSTSHDRAVHARARGRRPANSVLRDKQSEAEPHPLLLQSVVGQIEVGQELDYHDIERSLYDPGLVLRRSYAGVGDVAVDTGNVDHALGRVRHTIDRLMQVISVVERDRLEWHTERFVVRDANGGQVVEAKRYRWCSPVSKNFRAEAARSRELRPTVGKMLAAYEAADADKAEVVDRIIESFKVASATPIFEPKFIHWHSCLDFFKTLHGHRYTRPFSRAVVLMCDQLDIPLDDLLPSEEVKSLRQGDKPPPIFRFTELRNDYIHDGFDAITSRFADAHEDVRTMRALAERLLLQYLGIDYRETNLGVLGAL